MKEFLITVIASVLAALLAVYLKKQSTIKKEMRLKQEFFDRVSQLSYDFKFWFPYLVHEYENSNPSAYSCAPNLDLTLIFQLIRDLSGTDSAVEPETHTLINRLTTTFTILSDLNFKRNQIIDRKFDSDLNFDEHKDQAKIRFNTACMLINAIEVIFYLSKVIEEKERFTIEEHYTYKDYAKLCCMVTKIEFQESFWKKIDKHFEKSFFLP